MEIGQSVMANDLVMKTFGPEILAELTAEFKETFEDMVISRVEDETLEYASTSDACNALFEDFLALDSTKQIFKKATDKVVKALSTTDTQNLNDELEKIFESLGITGEMFDEMLSK